jgi:putative transposase
LAVVIDLFSHQVVGWSLQEAMARSIVIDALRMAPMVSLLIAG